MLNKDQDKIIRKIKSLIEEHVYSYIFVYIWKHMCENIIHAYST